MIKTIIYGKEIIGINPTKICKMYLDVDEDGECLIIEYDNSNVQDTHIPDIDFSTARELIKFLNNPDLMTFSLD